MRVLSSAVLIFMAEENATESLEWALIAGLIVIGGLSAILTMGPKITQLWTSINTSIP
jgi:Flp pilus assembly pilin Flp